jgi:hypothetical protein
MLTRAILLTLACLALAGCVWGSDGGYRDHNATRDYHYTP